MWENIQVKRLIENFLPAENNKQLVLLTGARQTGKTTLLKKSFSQLPYYNLDAIEFREQLSQVSTFAWGSNIGNAVFDEIQKEPMLLEKIKYAYDDKAISFSVMSGSAQILLMQKIKETLAGRIALFELYPFLFSELLYSKTHGEDKILLDRLINTNDIDNVLETQKSVLVGEEWELHESVENYLMKWGGMPPLIHLTKNDSRVKWLYDYGITYLERDLVDLASLKDLKPFRRFQQIASLRSGNLLSYSEIARDGSIGIETTRRYLQYLDHSYQSFTIAPYHTNLTSRMIKTPKLYWMDNGLLRSLSGIGFEVFDGRLYENYLAAEIKKYLKTIQSQTQLSFYRTRSGMEIDFLLEGKNGLLLLEAKKRYNVVKSDFTAMKRICDDFGEKITGGIVLYRGNKIIKIGPKLWAVPSFRIFA